MVILNGPYVTTKTNDKGIVSPKLTFEWDENDIKKIQFNAKALNSLHCASSIDEYKKISSYKTAKEVWDKLEVTHEGTS